MVRVKPFAAVRPPQSLVKEVASRPYDVLNSSEAQAEALQKSLDKTLALLSEVAKSALEEIYGDLNEYLTVRIEAEVKNQKGTPTAVLNVTGAPLESKDEPDDSGRSAQLITELLGLSSDALKEKAAE